MVTLLPAEEENEMKPSRVRVGCRGVVLTLRLGEEEPCEER